MSSQPPAEVTPRERLSPWDWQGHKDLVSERLAALALDRNEYGYDPFGTRPEDQLGQFALAAWLHDHYFRCKVSGLENVPGQGGALLIANHAGQVPTDGAMIGTALLLDRQPPRLARPMAEFWFADQPFLSTQLYRTGALIGTRRNCLLQLGRGELVMVFPEGQRGMNKTFDNAYKLMDFGLGFMRMALEVGVPIVPIAVVGSEEQNPGLFKTQLTSRLMGLPDFPVTPTFPLLGPLGLLPLPTRYHIYFAEPRTFEGDPDADDAEIEAMVNVVRRDIETLFEQGKRERKGIFR